MGAILGGLASSFLGGGLSGILGGGGDPIGQVQSTMQQSLQQQAELVQAQIQFQNQKEALDAIAATANSAHQGKENSIQNISGS